MPELRELSYLSVLLRILAAVLLGGLIGVERGMKNRAAGLRTYMLVCIGSCMVMMTNQYVSQVFGTQDIVRMGAQVISGIGFLGAGTIIITGNNRVKGLTTAAGLWAAACVGLSVGIGFYEVAFLGTVAIVLVLTLLQLWDKYMRRYSRSAEIYVELQPQNSLGDFLKNARSAGIRFHAMDLQSRPGGDCAGLSFLATVKSKNSEEKEQLLASVRSLEGVRFCEELF